MKSHRDKIETTGAIRPLATNTAGYASNPKMLSIREAAELFCCSEPTIAKLIKSGHLPAHRVGGIYRIEQAVLLTVMRTDYKPQ